MHLSRRKAESEWLVYIAANGNLESIAIGAGKVPDVCEAQHADLNQFAKIDHALGFLEAQGCVKRLAYHVAEVRVGCEFGTSLLLCPELDRPQ